MEENDLKNLSSSEVDAVSDLEKNSISIQAGDPSIKMVRFSLERESKGSRWKENVSQVLSNLINLMVRVGGLILQVLGRKLAEVPALFLHKIAKLSI